MPSFCRNCRLERDPATVGRMPCPDCGSTSVDAVAYAQAAHATATAHPPTVITTSTGYKIAQGKADLSVRFEARATGHRVRVVEETGTVVRVIRYQRPTTERGRGLGSGGSSTELPLGAGQPESSADDDPIAFASRSRSTSRFAMEHSVCAEPSPKQQVAGSSLSLFDLSFADGFERRSRSNR
jgi:hypothetical protein